jgi:hypothetical protein
MAWTINNLMERLYQVAPTRLIIGGILLILVTAPSIVTSVRRGHFTLRGPHGRVDRQLQPTRFWLSIGVRVLFTTAGVLMFLLGLSRVVARSL